MGISKPFRRNYRAMKPSVNAGYSQWAYTIDKEYAQNPSHFVRAFLLIQNDLQKLFEYVEPGPESIYCYSYRSHELLMRACIEVEANFKAILLENIYSKTKHLNMDDYKKVNSTHRLSSYEVKLPIWNGPERIFRPFEGWSVDSPIEWYRAYNNSKHDRQNKFKEANIENLILAVSGLLVLISSQFYQSDYTAGSPSMLLSGYDYYDMDSAIGSFFRIRFPNDWSDHEMYDFDWSRLKSESDRFQQFNYDSI